MYVICMDQHNCVLCVCVCARSIMKPWHPGNPKLPAVKLGRSLHTGAGCQRWRSCRCARGSVLSQCKERCLHLHLVKHKSTEYVEVKSNGKQMLCFCWWSKPKTTKYIVTSTCSGRTHFLSVGQLYLLFWTKHWSLKVQNKQVVCESTNYLNSACYHHKMQNKQ